MGILSELKELDVPTHPLETPGEVIIKIEGEKSLLRSVRKSDLNGHFYVTHKWIDTPKEVKFI
jgi:hypothetical protein